MMMTETTTYSLFGIATGVFLISFAIEANLSTSSSTSTTTTTSTPGEGEKEKQMTAWQISLILFSLISFLASRLMTSISWSDLDRSRNNSGYIKLDHVKDVEMSVPSTTTTTSSSSSSSSSPPTSHSSSSSSSSSSLSASPSTSPSNLAWQIFKFSLPLMGYIYTSYTGAFEGSKVYDFDLFWALHILLFLASLIDIRKTDAAPLNRDQTEEWKGWMQVIFLAYHYFGAKGLVYNLVRILIAAYVWMTGFGHFIYFYTTDNFDIVRIVRTLFRLNWLVFFTCLATDNEYMLYYICAMHTFWFIFVLVTMRIAHHRNKEPGMIPFKFAVAFLVIVVLFEVDGLLPIVFSPLSFLLGKSTDSSLLYEWNFRLGLDHYAAFVGMICGYYLPEWKRFLIWIEAKDVMTEWGVKGAISLLFLIANYFFIVNIFVLDKFEYNSYHPYWSWLPVVSFLWFRNLSLTLRTHYIFIFSWWGKVTLESYISQLHLLLTRNAALILLVFPEEYRLLNMIAMSIIFAISSKVLFDGTVYLCQILCPEPASMMFQRWARFAVIFSVLYFVSVILSIAY